MQGKAGRSTGIASEKKRPMLNVQRSTSNSRGAEQRIPKNRLRLFSLKRWTWDVGRWTFFCLTLCPQEPIHELWQTDAQWRRRIVPEQLFRLRNISTGDGHIAGLLGQLV